ncbi:protein translocase subunit SecDF [Mesomycoplasma neurolyticum]|uniref:Bifunctional preprotein translocase subunit SecD/SecF n=1 Tax=Mesomycoplasma neurolyticum TaxID=2120 RepID=A0A449A6B8_9BACT|nr:protein translocase subunit SecDF [Mesomycoplasma neurolyticum]VEU59805.1 bifunctional preprotein translocase subunit SecD/SecF [Mesomycoplasma neurolyticum]
MIKRFLSKIFSPKNWKRWLILFFTFSFAFTSIFLGSNYYVSKNINKSIEYGGGAEVLIQVVDSKTNDKTKISDEKLSRVDKAIFERLAGDGGLNGTQVSIEGEGRIRVSRSGIETNDEINNFVNEIISKQRIILTDINGNPIFYNGVFRNDIKIDFSNKDEIENLDESLYVPPFKQGSAKEQLDQNGGHQIQISLEDKKARLEWTKATKFISEQPNNVILIWQNYKNYLLKAADDFPEQWKNSGFDPYVFAHVNESLIKSTEGNKNLTPTLKESEINAKNYLVSSASVATSLSGETFVIQGKFTNAEAKQLALNINYGIDDYSLKFLSSSFVQKELGENSFNLALIAGAISIVLIAIFMIINYGLLGVLTTISLSLYIFLTLLFFTIVRGEYSPSSIAALIIGIGMSVDANIISFERLKKEIYNKSSTIKANAHSNKLSFSTIMDSNITTFLVAIVLFFFGTKEIKSFAITLIFSIFFTLLMMLFFTRQMTNILVKTGVFNKRLWLLGVNKKYIKYYSEGYVSVWERPNYNSKTKYFMFAILAFVVISLIVFIIFGIINKKIFGGFVLSLEFSGGTNLLIETQNLDIGGLSFEKANNIKDFLVREQLIANANDISINKVDSINDFYQIVVKTQQEITNNLTLINNKLNDNFDNIKTINYSISSDEARNLVKNAFTSVLIALAVVSVYILIRMQWTFSIAAILSLTLNVIIVLLFFTLTRLTISPIFVAGILSIIGYSINDTIVVFDRIKELTSKLEYKNYYDKTELKLIVNNAIKDTIKRSIFTSLTTITIIIVLMIFKDSTNIFFNIALLVGISFGTFSSLFVATNIWLFVEIIRNKNKKKRIDKNYWNTQKINEQTFTAINDFNK